MYYDDTRSNILKDLIKDAQNVILEHLNPLINNGVLKLELGPCFLVEDVDPTNGLTRVGLRQKVRLTVDAERRILELMEENRELKERLETIQKTICGAV